MSQHCRAENSPHNSFTFGDFELSGLWEWQQGGDVVNLGLFLTDIGGTSEDFLTEEGQARANGVGGTGRFIEDATYLKLRELSLSYNLPRSLVNSLFNGQVSYLRLGLAGRNLIMITDYKGYDPEVGQFGNERHQEIWRFVAENCLVAVFI